MDSVFGLVGADFAIIASDSSAARSILVFKHDEDKIMKLDDHKLLVGAGVPADSSNFMEFVSKNLKLYELNNDLKLETRAAAHFIRGQVSVVKSNDNYLLDFSALTFVFESLILYSHNDFICIQLATALRKGPYQTNLLLAGYDANVGPSLYWMDYLAALSKVNFGAHGYAASFVLSVFDRDWKAGLTQEEGLDIIRKCIHELKTRFLISQPVFTVKVVDRDGTRVVTL
jgi:20S proteasome alpha/beta subunit